MSREIRPLVALAVLWLALLGADRWIRPTPGLAVAYARSGAPEPEFERREGPPFDRVLDDVAAELGPGFAVRYEGVLRLLHAGVYHAAIGADAGSSAALRLDGELLVATGPAAESPRQSHRELAAGLHAFDLEYRNGGAGRSRGAPQVGLVWSKGVPANVPVPPEAVFEPHAAGWRFSLSLALRLGAALTAGLGWVRLCALGLGAVGARTFHLQLASLLVGAVLSLGVAELALRIAGVAPREYVPGTIWHTYAYPQPGSTTRYVGYLPYLVKEFEETVRINSRGWRDREFAYPKPPGVVRIVVVGDSYVEGKEVPLEHTIHKRLEALLNRELGRPGRRFEVIGLARGGISTEMEYRVIRERALRYAPDVVVLAFFAGNDVRDNAPALEARFSRWLEQVYMAQLAPARIRCTDALAVSARSLLVNVVTGAVCDFYVAHLDWFRDGLSERELVSPGIDVYRPDAYDADWREGWRASEQWIVRSRDATEAADAAFLLLLVHSAQLAGARGGGEAAGREGLDLDAPFRILAEICERNRIECLDLKPVFDRFERDTGERYYWRYDAHWNEAGHRVAAQALFERLAPALRERAP